LNEQGSNLWRADECDSRDAGTGDSVLVGGAFVRDGLQQALREGAAGIQWHGVAYSDESGLPEVKPTGAVGRYGGKASIFTIPARRHGISVKVVRTPSIRSRTTRVSDACDLGLPRTAARGRRRFVYRVRLRR